MANVHGEGILPVEALNCEGGLAPHDCRVLELTNKAFTTVHTGLPVYLYRYLFLCNDLRP